MVNPNYFTTVFYSAPTQIPSFSLKIDYLILGTSHYLNRIGVAWEEVFVEGENVFAFVPLEHQDDIISVNLQRKKGKKIFKNPLITIIFKPVHHRHVRHRHVHSQILDFKILPCG